MLSIPLMTGSVSSDEAPSREITGKKGASGGLLQSGSFSTVEVWDQDKDGKDEVYLGGAGRSSPKTQGIIAYEYNTATSTWAAFGSGLPTTGYFGGLGLGDVNKDGFMDIAAPAPTVWYSGTDAVYLYTSNAQGAFTLAHDFDPGISTNEAEIADIDADGNKDVAWTYYGGLTVMFGSGSATSWTESSPTAAGNELTGLAIGDLNRDGKLDIVSTPYYDSNKVRLYVQGSSRSWTEVNFKTVDQAFGVKIADLNNDGKNDVVYGTRSAGIKVWTGDGASSVGGTSFTWTDNSSGLPTGSGDWAQLELGDVNEDGKLDIIASASGQNRTRMYVNNQPSSWTELFSSSAEGLYIGGNAYGANFGDWDGDDKLDCAGSSWGGGVDAWIIKRSGTTPPPVNKAPVPKAGADVSIMLGRTANLNGRNSTDAEDAPSGDAGMDILGYDWNVTQRPPGSAVTDGSLVPSDTSGSISFVPDRVGNYVLSLAVSDTESKWSAPGAEDLVQVSVVKPNDAPTASAGPDQSAYVGDTVELDGSASRDLDGAIVTWEWSCSNFVVPFTNPNTARPSFVPDTSGDYSISLRVRDNNMTWSAPDTMTVVVREEGEDLPPVANAGPDQSVLIGTVVALDGSGSNDPDGSITTWEWTSTSHPSLVLGSPDGPNPSFTPSAAGSYVFRLRVRDSNGTWSQPDEVIVTVEAPYFNERPVAEAGPDQAAQVGDAVTLDGRMSTDGNGIVASYNWTCTSHAVTLNDARSSRPSFTPNAAGTYVFELRVEDDEGAWSGPDIVRITVTERPVPKRFTITVGPFSFNDSSPLLGAQVTLTLGSSVLTGTVGPDGMVGFQDVLSGTYGVKVVLNGTEVISGRRVVVGEDGEVSYPDGPFPQVVKKTDPPIDDDDQTDDDDTQGMNPLLLVVPLVLLALIMVVVPIVIFLGVSKKSKSEEAKKEGPMPRKVPSKKCPTCKKPMEHKKDFNRYYCNSCKGYR